MKRTQLYIDEEMSRLLSAESRRRKTTVSALVREAVAATYGRVDMHDRTAIIDRVAGVWADRTDIGDTDAFIRSLRRSTRLTRGRRAQVSPRHRHHH